MDITKKREILVAQIFYLFILPVVLFYFDVIPGNFRVAMLFVITLLLLGIIYEEKWTFADMGIKKNWTSDVRPYAIFTILAVAFLFAISETAPHFENFDWWQSEKFLLLFAPISILQEIIFRGVLMKMLLGAFKNIPFVILINATVFAVLHIIYLNSAFILPLTFFGGICFAYLYYKWPNLILISISHTIINFTAMILGFFALR